MSVIATTNTQHYENIADGLRTAGDLSNYKSELAVDAEIFEDISDALQSKTGQQEPYAKDELAQAVSDLPTDLISKTITENGVYNASSDNVDGYDVVTVSVPQDLNENFDKFMNNTLENYYTTATVIPDSCFHNKTRMLTISMPNAITLGSSAFRGCINLTNANLVNGVTTITGHLFRDCRSLVVTTLPTSVTIIGLQAFTNCTSIPYLDFSDFDHVITLDNVSAFTNTTFPFYFKDQQQLDEWAAATNWSTLTSRFQIKPSEVI